MLKVFNQCCKNCLLSDDRIVSPSRAKQLIQDCSKNQTYFICHKATMKGDKEIVCKKFYDQLGHKSQMIRIAERLGAIEFVDQEDLEKLPTYKELNRK